MSDSLRPVDCSPPGSSAHRILQARILEWVAMPSSRGSSRLRDQTWGSCVAGPLSHQGGPVECLRIINPMSAIRKPRFLEVPGGSEVKASACNVRDPGSIPESGRYPGEGNGNPLQYSCLENSMEFSLVGYSPWGCKSQTRLSD